MKQDITKAIQFSNTFRYIDDLFSINNVNFGNCISAIYPSELELKDTSTSSTEVCYLDTNIKTGDVTTPFRISIYDKRHNIAFWIGVFDCSLRWSEFKEKVNLPANSPGRSGGGLVTQGAMLLAGYVEFPVILHIIIQRYDRTGHYRSTPIRCNVKVFSRQSFSRTGNFPGCLSSDVFERHTSTKVDFLQSWVVIWNKFLLLRFCRSRCCRRHRC